MKPLRNCCNGCYWVVSFIVIENYSLISKASGPEHWFAVFQVICGRACSFCSSELPIRSTWKLTDSPDQTTQFNRYLKVNKKISPWSIKVDLKVLSKIATIKIALWFYGSDYISVDWARAGKLARGTAGECLAQAELIACHSTVCLFWKKAKQSAYLQALCSEN